MTLEPHFLNYLPSNKSTDDDHNGVSLDASMDTDKRIFDENARNPLSSV